MIIDNTLLFSDDQAITASAASTNSVDLGAASVIFGDAAALARDVGRGVGVPLLVQVTEDFDNLTSLQFIVEVDDNSSFSSAKTVAQSTAIPLAQLVAGATWQLMAVPAGSNERYMRVRYVVVGTAPTAGTVTAAIVGGVQASIGVPFVA